MAQDHLSSRPIHGVTDRSGAPFPLVQILQDVARTVVAAMTYKARLAQTRANDAAHEQMMQDAARKAGVDLAKIRNMIGKTRDNAMTRMFEKARASK